MLHKHIARGRLGREAHGVRWNNPEVRGTPCGLVQAVYDAKLRKIHSTLEEQRQGTGSRHQPSLPLKWCSLHEEASQGCRGGGLPGTGGQQQQQLGLFFVIVGRGRVAQCVCPPGPRLGGALCSSLLSMQRKPSHGQPEGWAACSPTLRGPLLLQGVKPLDRRQRVLLGVLCLPRSTTQYLAHRTSNTSK